MTGDDRHLRLVVEHDQGPVGRGITPLMPINRGDFDTAGNPIQRIEVQTTRSRGQLRRRLTPALNDRCWPMTVLAGSKTSGQAETGRGRLKADMQRHCCARRGWHSGAVGFAGFAVCAKSGS